MNSILPNKVSKNARNGDKDTLVIVAAELGAIKALDFLIQEKANLNALDEEGLTAVCRVIKQIVKNENNYLENTKIWRRSNETYKRKFAKYSRTMSILRIHNNENFFIVMIKLWTQVFIIKPIDHQHMFFYDRHFKLYFHILQKLLHAGAPREDAVEIIEKEYSLKLPCHKLRTLNIYRKDFTANEQLSLDNIQNTFYALTLFDEC